MNQESTTNIQVLTLLEVPEPHPDQVNGEALANHILSEILKYLHLSKFQAYAITLWCMGTYCMDCWKIWPKLLINSPQKRCGKTTLVTTLEAVCLKSLIVASISPAALFRVIHKYKPTLLIDEADISVSKNEELNALINASHNRRSAKVVRSGVGSKNFEPEIYDAWCPQVIAGIGSQKDTLHDRSIVIGLERKPAGQNIKKLPIDYFDQANEMRNMCLRWVIDNKTQLINSEVNVPSTGNDRAEDNWYPLFSIAEVIGGSWPDKIKGAFEVFNAAAVESEDIGESLIADIKLVLEDFDIKESYIFSKDLVANLNLMEDSPWSEFSMGKPLTPHKLSKLLRQFKIRPTTVQYGVGSARKQAKGYRIEELQTAIERYAPDKDKNVTALQPAENEKDMNNESVTATVTVTDSSPVSVKNSRPCNAVTFSGGK